MNDATITCPNCGLGIPLSEAVSRPLREQLEADFVKRRAELNAALAEREKKLADEKAALEARAQSVQTEVAKQLEAERQKLLAAAARQAEARLGLELKDLQTQVADQRAKLQAAQQTELDLRQKKRELEDARAALELDLARKLDAERQKIADTARQQGAEAERLKLADKEKVIADLQREIQNLKQKAEQGSMQLQGETLELTLEADLRAAFPLDDIAEVKKGARGADVTQRVRTNTGVDCGAILWEAKRAKNWSADWPEKLKADQREARAEFAVIVTTCPPEAIRGLGPVDGVWVCEPAFAVALAAALRQGLVSTAAQRRQEAGRADKMALLYDHLCSVEFRQHIEVIVESFRGLRDQLAAEQRAFHKQWKEREQQLHKAINHTAMLYGGIQGIAGRQALPEIPTLALPAGDDPTTATPETATRPD
jgi:hypothetical protein